MTAADSPGQGRGRKLGPVLAVFYVAGNIIGAGIYGLPAEIGAVGGVSVIGWVIAAIGAFAVGTVLSILASRTGDPDGLVGYAGKALSPYWGFLVGVMYWFSNVTGLVGLAIACAGYLTVYAPVLSAPLPRSLAALAVLWLTSGICLVGARAVGRFSAVFLVAGVAPLLFLAAAGWTVFDPHLFARSWNVSGKSDLDGVGASVLAAYFAFTGLETGAMISATVRNPRRDVPLATMGGIALAAVLYLAIVVVIMGLEPARAYAASGAPLALAVSRIGPGWAGLIAAFALTKILGTLSGITLATAEAARATFDARPFARPPDLAKRSRTPVGILVWTAAGMGIAALATTAPSFARQFGTLVDLSASWTLIPYLVCVVALAFILRSEKGRIRWGVSAVGLVAFVVTGGVLLTAAPLSYALTGALVAAVSIFWFLRSRRPPKAA